MIRRRRRHRTTRKLLSCVTAGLIAVVLCLPGMLHPAQPPDGASSPPVDEPKQRSEPVHFTPDMPEVGLPPARSNSEVELPGGMVFPEYPFIPALSDLAFGPDVKAWTHLLDENGWAGGLNSDPQPQPWPPPAPSVGGFAFNSPAGNGPADHIPYSSGFDSGDGGGYPDHPDLPPGWPPYEPPTNTPEPSSMVVLAGGALLGLLRPRREVRADA